MSLVQVGASKPGRSLDHELPLVPFIDFLLCLIAFLLVTAVWSTMARLPADARVPGMPSPSPAQPEPELHVRLLDGHFELSFRRGDLVLEQERIPRSADVEADGSRRYPKLAEAVAAHWKQHGRHRAVTDAARDRAVLHTTNSVEFADIAAALDAIAATKRPAALGAPEPEMPAFFVSFAAD